MDVKDKFIIDTVLEKYQNVRDPALIILQNIQAVLGYVGKEYLEYVSENTDYSLTELYGIVTFYPSFRLEPPGKHTIKVCQGTACHVRGGEKILKEMEAQLEIKPGGTTKDRLFSLEMVRCLGCCGLSPVIMIDGETYGRVKPAKIRGILEKYREATP
jgi:NADH:ubiquinone oxidoreductase subunit E